MLQRRAVLAALGSAMVVSFAPIKVLASTQVTRRNQFAELIGSRLHLKDAEGVVTIARLVALDDGPNCPGIEQFSIVFEGKDLTNGDYELNTREMGRMTIGLMPSGIPNQKTTRKRAHFSVFI